MLIRIPRDATVFMTLVWLEISCGCRTYIRSNPPLTRVCPRMTWSQAAAVYALTIDQCRRSIVCSLLTTHCSVHFLKCTVEKYWANATSVIMPNLFPVLWRNMWKYTMEKIQTVYALTIDQCARSIVCSVLTAHCSLLTAHCSLLSTLLKMHSGEILSRCNQCD